MEKRHKCIIITSLLWIMLVMLFDPDMVNIFQYWSHSQKELYRNILNFVTLFFYLLLPVLSLLAHKKFGQLNMVIICILIGALCSLSYIVLSVFISPASDIVISVIVPIALTTRVYFDVLVLCFIADELTEQSCKSDHFSTFIWWRNWCTYVGAVITQVSSCLFKDNRYYEIGTSSAHFIFLLIIIISALSIKKWTIRYNYSVNPLKLIFDVLRFAFKNKYPLNRSALTYWEEAEPSRINLGKAKYGGPFQEKDVESVKTFFRLIPLLLVTLVIFVPYQTLARLLGEKVTFSQCLLFGTYIIEYTVVIIAVPVYQCIIKPFCFTRIRMSILQRTGLGIALTVLGKLGFIILDLSISVPAYVNYNETMCFLESTINGTSHYDLTTSESYSHYYAIPSCINSIGVLLIIAGSLEFVFAQAPLSMRGLLLGLWFSISGIYGIAGWMMIKPFKAVSEYLVPSCELYILIMNFLFMLLSLILFIFSSRRYKLHSCEDVFNANDIAEMYYEKEFNRRDHINNYGSMTSADFK